MLIACLLEPNEETRVAITPHAAKNYISLGLEVAIEKDAGSASGFSNKEYEILGVQVISNKNKLVKQTDILLSVNQHSPKDLEGLKANSILISHVDSDPQNELIQWSQLNKITLISMNFIPRISRAQSIDSLSSQANIAGYRAVLEGISHFHRVIPMMMTAAGMIQPAKVLVLGAGVAGLQAIATAKRLGAVVYAFDVRSAAKEQVESLGAEFIEVMQNENLETKGGYATEASEEYKQLQAQLIDKYAKLSDLIISTALIPGQKAPLLLYKTTIDHMKPGSVIVDLATSRGGNCELSVPDKTIKQGGITIIGLSNMPGLVPTTASDLYANNLVHLIKLLFLSSEIQLNPEDEIVQHAVLCHQGNYLPFKEKENA